MFIKDIFILYYIQFYTVNLNYGVMMENNKKYYPYEKSDEFDILFEDNKFCVVFGKAEKGRIKSIGIRWLVDISE